MFHSSTEASQFWSIKTFHRWNLLYHRALVWSTTSHHSASEPGISLEHPVNGLNGSIKHSWFWCFIILSRQSIHTCFWHNYFITEPATAFAPGPCYLQSLTHWSVSATQAELVRRALILAHRLQKILPVAEAFSTRFKARNHWATRPGTQSGSAWRSRLPSV